MTRLSLVARTLILVLVCAPAVAAAPRQDPQPFVEPPQADPPAHISVVDGTAVLERDGEIDDSPANMPLLAGDRVRTRDGRVEILFADGGTLHLDANTTVDFQSDELVRLLEGRVRLSIPGPLRDVAYRIDAPSGWAQIRLPGEYRLAILRGPRGEELELAVLRGSAELLTDTGRTSLRAGERAYARANTAPSSAYVFNSASWDAFDRWSEQQRDLRLGASAQYLPDEVQPYAAAFDRYGSWRNDPSHGYVWYPTVSADWRPYYHGRWVALPSYGWTWVGRDRWDWPTHHYGRWGLSGGVWFWIPGRRWASAWVSWAYAPDYVSWCPLGWNNRPIIQINVFNRYDRWHPWTVVPRGHFGRGFVHARAVPFRGFDARTRGSFTYRNSGPDGRDYPRARAAAPIRRAGAPLGRAVPRGSSPVYTNLGPGDSRVNSGSRRVMVPPTGSAPSDARTNATQTPGRTRAIPRGEGTTAQPDVRPNVQVPGARQRSNAPAGRAATTPSPTLRAPDSSGRPGIRSSPGASAPDDSGRRGVRSAPRVERPAAVAPAPRGAPRGIERRPSESREPSSARPSAPSYDGGARQRRAPSEPVRPSAPSMRSTPRESPVDARPRAADRATVPAPSGVGRRGPAESRPSQPSAAPSERPSRSAPGARPRSGGERSGGSAVPRRRGGV